MTRQELKPLLDKAPFKFRTQDGTVVTCLKIIKRNRTTFEFLDKFNNRMVIRYSQIHEPIQMLNIP